MARYNRDGSLDTTFGGDGRVVTNFGSEQFDEAAYSGVVVTSTGEIIAAGTADALMGASQPDIAVARYQHNGTLDPTFSGDGKVLTDSGSADKAYGLALDTQGRIVIGGQIDFKDFELARYLDS